MALSTRLSSIWRSASSSAQRGHVRRAVRRRPLDQRERLRLGPRLVPLQAVGDRRVQRHRLELQPELARLDPGQAEQVQDQRVQPVRLCVDLRQERPRASGSSAAPSMQRLDGRLDDGQRRLQLVRDVGDEVLPEPLQPAQLGGVVEHHDRPGGGRPGQPGDVDGQAAVGRPLPVQLLAVRAGPAQRLLDDLLERPLAGHLPQLPADRRGRGELQQLGGPVVGEQHPLVGVERDHALDHARTGWCGAARGRGRSGRRWRRAGSLMALNGVGQVGGSRLPATRIWAESPSASRRAPPVSSTSGRANRRASRYAARRRGRGRGRRRPDVAGQVKNRAPVPLPTSTPTSPTAVSDEQQVCRNRRQNIACRAQVLSTLTAPRREFSAIGIKNTPAPVLRLVVVAWSGSGARHLVGSDDRFPFPVVADYRQDRLCSAPLAGFVPVVPVTALDRHLGVGGRLLSDGRVIGSLMIQLLRIMVGSWRVGHGMGGMGPGIGAGGFTVPTVALRRMSMSSTVSLS